MGEREVVFEVRSSELETRLSSSDDPVEAEGEIAMFGPSSSGWREIRPFHAFREECAIELISFLGLEIGFDSLRRSGFNFFVKGKKLVLSCLGKCASMRLLSSVALDSLSIHSSWNS